MKMLNWVQPFNIFCLLDNNQYNFEQPAFECLLATGSKESILPSTASDGDGLNAIRKFCSNKKDWIFGHVGYDLKKETDQFVLNQDGINFPDYHFFVPEIVVQLNETEVTISCDDDPAIVFSSIQATEISDPNFTSAALKIQARLSPSDYLSIVRKLKQHILRGDCYEINFCQEFYAEKADINPLQVYNKLVKLSPNPFASFYKLNDKYCICASPERYLKKMGNHVFSQPIKGTAKRYPENLELDNSTRLNLFESNKNRNENVMVVDLVRNDLSKICKAGTVQVDELFGIYSFPQVHQMISTISGELNDDTHIADILGATFPMGSMTGAPKKRVMQLIERYEQTKRGLFSGAIGYFHPNGNFDFNVVIRSILYNATAKYLSFQTGSAITFNSNEEEELEECMLKAAAIMKILE